MNSDRRANARLEALSDAKQALLRARLEGRIRPANASATAIPRRPAGEPCVLSFAQQRLWFLDQLVRGSPFYTESTATRIRGPINTSLLERALNTIVERHEVLRTTFQVVNSEPQAVVAPVLHIPLPITDLSHLRPDERLARAADLAAHEARCVFDLATGPLLRTTLLRLDQDDWIFLLSMHHIVCDGWSSGVFASELSEIYAAAMIGRPCALPELPIQYGDFAAWQRRQLRGDLLDRQLDYWREQLADTPVLELPTDRPRPAVFTYRGRHRTFRLGPALLQGLEQLGNQEGATLFMTLLTGFQILLHRYSGQEDIVIGCPVANRTRRELEPLIGFFVNVLLMRGDLSRNPSVRELLGRVRATALAAYAHQDLPFEKLVETLQPERDLARNPLFQVIFQLHARRAGSPPAGRDFSPLEVERTTVKFDLRLDFFHEPDGLRCTIEYSTDLFDADRIHRMERHLSQIYAEMIRAPDQHIDTIRIVQGAERALLLQWSGERDAAPLDWTIDRRFSAQAAQTPDAVAIAAANRSVTYGELDARANALAQHLRVRGAGPDVVLAMTAERSLAAIIAQLGILKAGAAYLPIDPADPPERLRYMLQNAAAKLLIDCSDAGDRFAGLGVEVIPLDPNEALRTASAPDPGTTPDHLAYVMYTSGSTGTPKGVCVPHRGVVRLVTEANYCAMGPDQVFLLLAPLTFDAATLEVWAPLLNGGRVAIYEEPHVTLEDLSAVLRRNRVTTLWLTSGLFHEAVANQLDSIGGIGQLIAGGDVLNVRHVRTLLERLPACRLINGYGPTENTTFTCCHAIALADLRSTVPIGTPIMRTRVYVVDRCGDLAPVGVPGELCVAGDGLARGYLNDPRLTAERFVPDPFSAQPGRMYRTGDLVRFLPSGALEFLGRIDRQVKIRGFRIEPGEIEQTLIRHPAVQEAVVLVDDGNGEAKRLAAYVVPRAADGEGTAPTLRQRAEANLVRTWQELYQRLYEHAAPNPEFDTSGWTASATGNALPAEHMREWRDAIVSRIAACRPRHVLEIGCGTGLLALAVIPQVQTYVGTDFAPVVLGRLETVASSLWPERSRRGDARFLARQADDFAGIEPQAFDTIILNSVVQYFPGLDYFLRVLERAIDAAAPGGSIFLGDLRSLPLLPVFHADVALARADPHDRSEEVRSRVEKAILLEQELLLDPALFALLPERMPRISGVDIQWKRGHFDNELSRYRYDVVLRLDGRPASRVTGRELHWREDRLTIESVQRILGDGQDEAVTVHCVPNTRVTAAAEQWRRLKMAESTVAIGDLLAEQHASKGPALEQLWEAGEHAGYGSHVQPELDGDCTTCVVRYLRQDADAAPLVPAISTPRKPGKWTELANIPLRTALRTELVPELRRYLKDCLPEYMQPAAIRVLDALPLTRNGKVDRAKLATLDREKVPAAAADLAPRNEIEARLKEIWAGVLNTDRIGVNDNFFELGGDSILCLQVVARAKAAGLHFTTRQLFENQTIATLSAVVSSHAMLHVDQGPIVGPTQLTPAQAWLLEQNLSGVSHFNQSILLEIPRALDATILDRALSLLIQHHDGLRLRCERRGGRWQAFYAPPDDKPILERCDLRPHAAHRRRKVLEQHCAQVQAGLDVTAGPLLRAVRYDLGPAAPARLLLAVHHLVIDGVSWRILLEDLWAAYSQLAGGQEPSLAGKTTSMHEWTRRLSVFADRAELAAELDYWSAVAPLRPAPLPTDGDGPNTVEESRIVRQAFTADETRSLLTDVPHSFRAQINDVLLSALARTLALWTGTQEAFFILEGHGREPLFEDVDLSRTIGWFTSIYPVRLAVDPDAEPGASVHRVKEQLQAVPRRGIGYGILRYLAGDPGVRGCLQALPLPEISFNYLGQFGARDPGATIRGAAERPGPMRHPQDPRLHLIEVDGSIAEGCLTFEWVYAGRRFARTTIERWSELFMHEVRRIIAASRSTERAGLSPGDFPDAELSEGDLQRLLASLSGFER